MREADLDAALAIVNEAAHAYRGVIPPDRWHDPYMPRDELDREIADGVVFWVAEEEGRVLGVMGMQDKGEVALVRHAYVTPGVQRKGVGTRLLHHVESLADKPVLIGTWANASWAVDFYRRNGFAVVSNTDKDLLLRRYWSIPARQVETSVVLADRRWRQLFSADGIQCVELAPDDVPRVQRFFEENPEYFLAVNGRAPGPGEAREEFEFQLPAGWPFEKKWILGFERSDGSLVGMADLVSNLFAEGVWHIGLFMVATSLHGGGAARAVHGGLESWMRTRGAQWIRLGVVEGNARAERFWEKLGYVDVRRRLGVEMGDRTNNLRVMVKRLGDRTLREYLGAVARDRPDSP